MTEKKKSNKGWIIALGILLALAIGGNALQFFSKKTEDKTDSTETGNNELVDEAVSETEALIASLEGERDMAINHIDSLEMEVSRWKEEVESVRQRSSSGSGISNSERNRLLGQIANLRNKIAAFANKEQLLDSAMSKNLAYEISLAQRNDSLNNLMVKVDQLTETVGGLETTKTELEDKINKAGQPVFGPLKVYGTDQKKSGTRTTFDASKIESIHVEYEIIGNNLFKGSLDQELKIRVTGPKGELYLKSGEIIEKSRQVDFTWIEQFKYSGKSKDFKYSFSPKKKLPKGKYRIELTRDNQLIHQTSFNLY